MKSLFIFLTLFPIVSGELRMVLAIWRHGDRAPNGLPYPKDPHGVDSWPRGWNQLTNKGMRRSLELGEWLRSRYMLGEGPLLKKQFDAEQVLIRSTESERAIQTAGAVSAGLFPPEGEFLWTSEIQWQPVPVHTNGLGTDDPLLRPTAIECPVYKEVVENENAALQERVNLKYKDLFVKLSNYSGIETVNFKNVKRFYDITREMGEGLESPSWINETWKGTTILDHIIELKRITRTSEFNSSTKVIYRGGFLLNDWMDKLQSAANESTNFKAILYSSHDGTVSSLLYALGAGNNQLVPYSALVLAELHQTDDHHFVKFFYKNGTFSLFPLTVPGCSVDCPLEDLIRLTEPMRIRTVQQLEQICSMATGISILVTIVVAFYNLSSYSY